MLKTEQDPLIIDIEYKKPRIKSMKQIKMFEHDIVDLKRGIADPLSANDIQQLGLCQKSIIGKEWHDHFPSVSRCLLNVESLSECLLYVSVLFFDLVAGI